MSHYEIMTFEMSVIQYYVFYSQDSYKKSNWTVLMKSITASNSLPCQFHYFSIAREDLSQERSITAAPYNHHLNCIAPFNAHEYEQSMFLPYGHLTNTLLSSIRGQRPLICLFILFYLLNNIWAITVGLCLAVN